MQVQGLCQNKYNTITNQSSLSFGMRAGVHIANEGEKLFPIPKQKIIELFESKHPHKKYVDLTFFGSPKKTVMCEYYYYNASGERVSSAFPVERMQILDQLEELANKISDALQFKKKGSTTAHHQRPKTPQLSRKDMWEKHKKEGNAQKAHQYRHSGDIRGNK